LWTQKANTTISDVILFHLFWKENRFIMLQRGTNIMENKVKTPIQNYFEKVLYENLTWEIPPLWFFRVVSGGIKIIPVENT
jgi:hypothetical protein